MKDQKLLEKIKQDPSWNKFVAIMALPYGWVVLSPWIQTVGGYWYRCHVKEFGYGIQVHEEKAKHLADQLNQYLR